MSDTPMTRAERRKRTEHQILMAARQLFAELGYDRTTVRAIADRAETDPALVMRYFGSKQLLFERIAEATPEQPIAGPPGEIEELLLESLRGKLDSGNGGTIALLRSMLTHPGAAAGVRATITDQQRQVAAGITADDPMTRAALVGMITLATVLGRDLLELEGLRDAHPDRITELLRPAMHSLIAT